MRKCERLNIQEMLKEAKATEYHEAYRTLYKSKNCKIGVVLRLTSFSSPKIFLEIIVYLCSSLSNVDLKALKKNIIFLEELRKRNYSMTCQDDIYILCEAEVTINKVMAEYHSIKSLSRKIYGKF